jgi:hypothetical protein
MSEFLSSKLEVWCDEAAGVWWSFLAVKFFGREMS